MKTESVELELWNALWQMCLRLGSNLSIICPTLVGVSHFLLCLGMWQQYLTVDEDIKGAVCKIYQQIGNKLFMMILPEDKICCVFVPV